MLMKLTKAILVILGVNLFIYLLFFVVSKIFYKEKLEDYKCDCRYKCQSSRIHLYGIIFTILAIIFAVSAGYFYHRRNANRNYSAAQSRNLNEECNWLNFYDNHDLWHFLSATAIFMAFLGLLTVDDDMQSIPRHVIPIK